MNKQQHKQSGGAASAVSTPPPLVARPNSVSAAGRAMQLEQAQAAGTAPFVSWPAASSEAADPDDDDVLIYRGPHGVDVAVIVTGGPYGSQPFTPVTASYVCRVVGGGPDDDRRRHALGGQDTIIAYHSELRKPEAGEIARLRGFDDEDTDEDDEGAGDGEELAGEQSAPLQAALVALDEALSRVRAARKTLKKLEKAARKAHGAE